MRWAQARAGACQFPSVVRVVLLASCSLTSVGREVGSRSRMGRFVRARDIRRVILREQPLLLVLPREEKEDERGAEQDRDNPSYVGGLIAGQERRLRRFGYLACIVRIALR